MDFRYGGLLNNGEGFSNVSGILMVDVQNNFLHDCDVMEREKGILLSIF